MTYYTYMESPVGRLLLAGDETGLQRVAFAEGGKALQPESDWRNDARPLRKAVEQLNPSGLEVMRPAPSPAGVKLRRCPCWQTFCAQTASPVQSEVCWQPVTLGEEPQAINEAAATAIAKRMLGRLSMRGRRARAMPRRH